MIKQITAYSFILIANMVLLAHAVIPHHHHQAVICIEQNHGDDDSLLHNHNVPDHDHQHDDNTNSTTCVLQQTFVVPALHSNLFKCCCNYSDNQNLDFYILSKLGLTELQPVSKVVARFPLHSSYLISFVTSTLGLRAPPIV